VIRFFALLVIFAIPLWASKPLQVVTTLPILQSIAKAIGGADVEVKSLGRPGQDPHFIQPGPDLWKKTRKADVLIEIGLNLELWAQKVVDESGNLKVRNGQPGRIVASAGIAVVDVPKVLSREFGDVHPDGNPHIWLDPIRVKKIAANIARGFSLVDPTHRDTYNLNLQSFQKRIDEALFGEQLVREVGGEKLTRECEAGNLFRYLKDKKLESKLGGWFKKAAPLRGQKIVTYHKSWSYFADRFGFTVPTEIEEKPGISPSLKYRDEVIALVKQDNVKTLVVDSYYDRSAADYIAGKTGARVIQVPIDVGYVKVAGDYFSLIDYLLDQLNGTK